LRRMGCGLETVPAFSINSNSEKNRLVAGMGRKVM
jgi:hypothetical protein